MMRTMKTPLWLPSFLFILLDLRTRIAKFRFRNFWNFVPELLEHAGFSATRFEVTDDEPAVVGAPDDGGD